MSEWSNWSDDKDSSSNKRKTRTKDKKQVVVPYVCVREPEYCQTMEVMTRNHRFIRPEILPEKLGALVSYYEAKWLDDSVAFAELRFEPGGDRPKTFRPWYHVQVSGSDNPDNNHEIAFSIEWEHLVKAGLLIPANVPGMFAALYEARRFKLQLLVVLCEGVKAMGAMQAKISNPEALSRFAEAGYHPVASAWFSGDYGAGKTNYAVRPANEDYVVTAKNDVAFPVDEVSWAIAMDTGDQGKRECRKVALTLCGKFNVSGSRIRIVDPIPGYETIKPDGYDDADDNPEAWTDLDRVDQIISAVLWPQHELYSVVIVIREGKLDQNITAVENALVGSGKRFYQHLGKLIKVCEVERTDFNGNEILVDRMVKCNSHALKQDISASAELVKWRGDEENGKLIPCNPPDNVVLAITHKICGSNIPLLHGIISAPTIRSDGSILQEAGYDRQSKLLFNPDGVTYPKVNETPSHEEVANALGLWQDLLHEFPFVDEVDRSVAISIAMTFLLRKSLNLSPAFGITSPDFGTGKTYLVDVFSTTATGSTAAVIQTGDDEEFRKRLETELLQGASAIALDNISLELRSDTLSAMLTSEFIKPRTLGSHYSTELPTNLVLTITGIQLKIRADLVRRILRTRLDAQVESPWKRSFKNDPLKMVRERRGEYVAALLTMRRAYHVSGKNVNFDSHCGYEQWSNSIGGTVKWLGLKDPFDSVELVKERDPEKSVLMVIMDEWGKAIGSSKVKCSEVIAKAVEEDIQGDDKNGFIRNRRYPAFYDALTQVAGGQDGNISTKRLGKYLDGLSRVVIGDRRFTEAGSFRGITEWRLETFSRASGVEKHGGEELLC